MNVILHEESHGASPFKDSIFEDRTKNGRRFFSLGFEEGMTELKARDMTRKLLGPKASEVFAEPKWAGKGPKGPKFAVEGVYATYQDAFLRESYNSISSTILASNRTESTQRQWRQSAN